MLEDYINQVDQISKLHLYM